MHLTRILAGGLAGLPNTIPNTVLEKLVEKQVYTVNEVAEQLGFSRRTVGRLLENEPGIVRLQRPETMNKRKYVSVRVPRAVLVRLRSKLQ